MPFNVQEIRSQLVGDGARPSQFEVRLQNPINASGDIKSSFMIKTAQLPASTMGIIEVPYFGRKVKIAGDRTFAEWTVNVLNDEDFLVRNALEEWSHAINTHETNVRNVGGASQLLYKAQAQVIQYSKTGEAIREYTFHGLFPSEVGAIELDWNTTDTIEEFPVTFQYDWWELSGGTTGNSTPA